MSEPIKNRYDFVVLFDVENGNPNGDPDAGNLPRIDPETQHGLITDACIKRKIRNYVSTVKEDADGYKIYIEKGPSLNSKDEEAIAQVDAKTTKEGDRDTMIKDYMCSNYFDIRTFGAVMTTFVKENLNWGQITGPVQIGFAQSVDPVMPQEITLTRVAITKETDRTGADGKKGKSTEMGKKSIVPYGLYRAEGFVSANLARKVTGFSGDDLNLLWEAIMNMFEHDHSAARGKMVVRELIIFKHQSELGSYPSHKLFEAVKVEKKDNVVIPRQYSDYNFTIDENSLPDTVEMIRMN